MSQEIKPITCDDVIAHILNSEKELEKMTLTGEGDLNAINSILERNQSCLIATDNEEFNIPPKSQSVYSYASLFMSLTNLQKTYSALKSNLEQRFRDTFKYR